MKKIIIAIFCSILMISGCSNATSTNKDNINSYEKTDFSDDKVTIEKTDSFEMQGDKYKYVISEFKNDDEGVTYWDIDIFSGDKMLQTITQRLSSNVYKRPDIKSLITEADINFDGDYDILVCEGSIGVQGAITYKAYVNTKGDNPFKILEGFSVIPNPKIDINKKKIISSNRENANTYCYNLYTVIDDQINKDLSLVVEHKESGLSDCTIFKTIGEEKQIVSQDIDIDFERKYSNDGVFDIGSSNWVSPLPDECNDTCND